MIMGFVLSLLLSTGAHADSRGDELQELKQALIAANSTKDQLADEIAELERVSVERARKIKELKERLVIARRDLALKMNEAAQQRKHAGALEAEMLAIEADIKNVEELEQSEMNSLEAMRKAELLKKEQLTALAAKLNIKKKKSAEKRDVAQQEVYNLQRENARLYDQIKSRGTKIRTTGETRPE